MKENQKKTLKITGFILIGLILFWLVYHKQDFKSIKEALKKANYWWLLFSMFLGLLSHISRSLRWRLLIEPLGYKPRNKTLFLSVMIMYLTNMAIPRSGEILRCTITSRYEKIPFTSLLGTVVTERIIDMIILLILTIVVAISQFSVVLDFLTTNESAQKTIQNITQSAGILIAIFVIGIFSLILLFVFRKKIAKTKIYLKFQKFIEDFVAGIKSVIALKNKWIFIAHSLFIWTMYFVMIYVAFWAFDFTSHYGVMVGLTAFVMASYGMVFPSPGGIGSWHFMVIETLFIYGLSRENGHIFAFGAHESQMIMLIIAGFIAFYATSLLKSVDSKINKNIETENIIEKTND
ncbi:MAG: flippase-like domain-containing protein [Bacteroidales bacterium]|nr:flippase-like domain-containing protein [Bacteroidales bacterium]